MGVCASKKPIVPTETLIVSAVRTKVPRLEPITHSSLAQSRLRRHSNASSEVVTALSSPVEEVSNPPA